MKLKTVVHCNGEEEHLPEGEFDCVMCGLLWAAMFNKAYNTELKQPDATIWSRCTAYGDTFYAAFIISGTDYGSKDSRNAAAEIGVLLALTLAETLADVR